MVQLIFVKVTVHPIHKENIEEGGVTANKRSLELCASIVLVF